MLPTESLALTWIVYGDPAADPAGATPLITPVVGSNNSQDGSPVAPSVTVRCKPLVAVTLMLTADPSVTAWLGADRIRGSGVMASTLLTLPPIKGALPVARLATKAVE